MSGSRLSMTSSAEFRAWIMFMVGMSESQFAPLFDHAPVGLLENAFEHLADARLGLAQSPDRLALFHGCADRLGEFSLERLVTRLIPFAPLDQVLLQPLYRITQRPLR